LIWVISAFVPIPFRFILWGIVLIIDIITPITAAGEQFKLPPQSTHLPERFGLFTIILIGEAVVSIVFTINTIGFVFLAEITGIFGLIIAFCIWWSYFEEAKGAEAKVTESGNKVSKYQLWLYSHFPLLLGVVTIAIGIKHVIYLDLEEFLPSYEAWLLCFSLALTFLSLNFIHLSSYSLEECKNRVLIIFRMPYYTVIILVLMTGFLGNLVPGWAFLGILTVLCLIKVIISLREVPKDLVCEL
jgi:low temperature requirement protein LtrA